MLSSVVLFCISPIESRIEYIFCTFMSHFDTFFVSKLVYVSDMVISVAHFKISLLVFFSPLLEKSMCVCLYDMNCQYFSWSLYLWWNFLLNFGFLFNVFEWPLFYDLL